MAIFAVLYGVFYTDIPMTFNMKRFTIVLTGLLLLPPLAHGAINVVVDNWTDGGGYSWNDDIGGGATRKDVINQAISDWEGTIGNNETIHLDMVLLDAGASYLGQWQGGLSYTPGDDIRPWYSGTSHTIRFNTNYFVGANYTWWDSTPGDDGSDQPFESWDALSVARHEFGHLFGFTEGFYEDNKGTGGEVDLWGDQIDGSNVFDAGGLNINMNGADHGHVEDAGATADDLMVPSIVNGTRRWISTTDTDMLELAYYDYQIIPEPMTISLLAFGGIGLLIKRRRNSSRTQGRD